MPCNSGYGEVITHYYQCHGECNRDKIESLITELDLITARLCKLSNAIIHKYGEEELANLVSSEDLIYFKNHAAQDAVRVAKVLEPLNKVELEIALTLLKEKLLLL